MRAILKNQNVCVLAVANKGSQVSVPSGNFPPCEGAPFGYTNADAKIVWDSSKSSWPYPGPAVPPSIEIPGMGYPKYLKDVPDQTPGIADGYRYILIINSV